MGFKISNLFKNKREGELTMTTKTTLTQGDINTMYKLDWMIAHKYGMLMTIVDLIARGEDEVGDIALAINITKEIEYLISMSTYIPEQHKETMVADNDRLRNYFVVLSTIH